jgi:hypothetical protein
MRVPSASPTQRRSSHAPPRHASMVSASSGRPTQTITSDSPTEMPLTSTTNQKIPTAMLATR